MTTGIVSADAKRASTLRRVPPLEKLRFRSVHADEGDVCAFELLSETLPITVESPTGRRVIIVPGDVFLATPGHRESRRWTVGRVPPGGLVPGADYTVLSDSGVVGELISYSPLGTDHLGRVRYLGAVYGDGGETLNIRQFAVTNPPYAERNTPVYLVLGTSSEVGKTTAGVAIVRALRVRGHTNITALKATGASSFEEIARYQDFGATNVFDCVDFGLPTTHPTGRDGIAKLFVNELDFCLSLPSEALVVECGGDPVSSNAPQFLTYLKTRCPKPKIIFSAADALGALGAKHALAGIGLSISLITGPCTDTPIMRERTEALCGIPALNLARGLDMGAESYISGLAPSD